MRGKINLLRDRQCLALAYGHVQMSVGHLPGGILKMVHVIFEGLAPAAVVIRHFAERVFPKERRHVVQHSAREHRGGEIASLPVDRVEFLTEPDKLLEIELGGGELPQLVETAIGYEGHPARWRTPRRGALCLCFFYPHGCWDQFEIASGISALASLRVNRVPVFRKHGRLIVKLNDNPIYAGVPHSDFRANSKPLSGLTTQRHYLSSPAEVQNMCDFPCRHKRMITSFIIRLCGNVGKAIFLSFDLLPILHHA